MSSENYSIERSKADVMEAELNENGELNVEYEHDGDVLESTLDKDSTIRVLGKNYISNVDELEEVAVDDNGDIVEPKYIFEKIFLYQSDFLFRLFNLSFDDDFELKLSKTNLKILTFVLIMVLELFIFINTVMYLFPPILKNAFLLITIMYGLYSWNFRIRIAKILKELKN